MKVILAAALSADGFIGKHASDISTRWTSKEDGAFFRELSRQISVLIVGSKTFATFNKKMGGRKFFVYSSRANIENPFENEFEVVQETPRELVARLEADGVQKALIAGGSSVYTQFLQAGVVDELYLTIEPILFGSGVPFLNDEIVEAYAKLTLIEVISLSDQIKVFHYKMDSRRS